MKTFTFQLRELLSIRAILFLLTICMVTMALAQRKDAKPSIKLTVKDGQITSLEEATHRPELTQPNERVQPTNNKMRAKPEGFSNQSIKGKAIRKIENHNPHQPAKMGATNGWETIYSEDFENGFQGPWAFYQGTALAHWGVQDQFANSGSSSAFCGATGDQSFHPGEYYLNDMNSWMVYGPFDLSDAEDAVMTFKYWYDSESGFDFFGWYASTDATSGFNGYFYSGTTTGWQTALLDFKNVPGLGDLTGQSEVYIGFQFFTDSSVEYYEGAFVDDIEIRKRTTSQSLPDLSVSGLSMSTSAWNHGQNVTVNLSLSNLGDVSVNEDFKTAIYLSSNSLISAEDVKIHEETLSTLSLGTTNRSYSISVPNLPNGTYYIGAITDTEEVIEEQREGNNEFQPVLQETPPTIELTSGSLPNIDVQSVAVDNWNWYAGHTVTGFLLDKNIGAIATEGHNSRMYLSRNDWITEADMQLGDDFIFPALSPGEEVWEVNTIVIPDLPTGTYYLGTLSDTNFEVPESDEFNMGYFGTQSVSDQVIPDLTPYSISTTAYNWTNGGTVTVELTEQNLGTANAGPHASQLYLSADDIINASDVLLTSGLNFSTISAGDFGTAEVSFTVPPVATGEYYLGVITDYTNGVAESNESDNASGWVTVYVTSQQHPDLEPTDIVEANYEWNIDEEESLSLRVINNGSANSGTFSSGFYLSSDDILSEDDVQLGADITYSSLPAGVSQNKTLTFTVPSLPEGGYHIFSVVDLYSEAVQVEEGNDFGYHGQVTLLPPLKTQTEISFSVTNKTYGDPTFSLSPQSNSPESFSYVSSNDQIVSLNGSQATITGTGQVTLTISQPEGENHTAGEATQTITVDKASLTITAEDKSMAYGDVMPELTMSFTGFVYNEDEGVITVPNISTEATTSSNAGVYSIDLTGGEADNYEISYVAGTLSIAKVSLSATADNKARTYGQSNPELTISYSGFVHDENPAVLDSPPVASTAANTNSDAGSYAIDLSPGSDNNYTIEINNGILTISKASLEVQVQDASMTYGGVFPEFSQSISGFVNEDDESDLDQVPQLSVGISSNADAGTYPIESSGGADNNYIFSYTTGTLTIGKANLTVSADDKSRPYGEPNPEFTISYQGFVNGDVAGDLDNPVEVSTSADMTSDVGSYDIVLSGGSDINYNLSLQNGTLTIVKADQSIDFQLDENVNISTGSIDLTASATSGLTVVFSSSNSSVASVNSSELLIHSEGTVEITASQAGNNNYNAAPDVVRILEVSQILATEDELLKFKVYPNPVSDVLNIEAPDEIEKMEMINIGGKVIETRDGRTTSWNVAHLDQGIYFLRLHTDSGETVMRRILVRQ